MSTRQERYISNQEKIKARAIARLLTGQKREFVAMLDGLEEKKSTNIFEIKADKLPEDALNSYLDSIKGQIPDYLSGALPPIMDEGAKESIDRYQELLPEGYALAFDIP